MLSINDIKKKCQRLWPKLLEDSIRPIDLFPITIPLAPPNSRMLIVRFEDVRQWIKEINHFADQQSLAINTHNVQHRQLGTQTIPKSISIDNPQTLVTILKKEYRYSNFLENLHYTKQQLPQLSPWLETHTQIVDQHHQEWQQLINITNTITNRNQKNEKAIFLRELNIPGIDSKFIEKNTSILTQLLEQTLTNKPAIQDNNNRINQFCQHFGFHYDQPLIRFRWLDEKRLESTGYLSDLTIPLIHFSAMKPGITTVFITENKINGLSFPCTPSAMIIFGLGYGLESLQHCEWLREKRVYYWGDIDTHGFHMLARLRQFLPFAQSLLMDEKTFLQCQTYWGVEPSQQRASLPLSLTENESNLYHALTSNKYGQKLRLEQERIPFALVETAIALIKPNYSL